MAQPQTAAEPFAHARSKPALHPAAKPAASQPRHARPRATPPTFVNHAFKTLYTAPALTQIAWIKTGLGAQDAKTLLARLSIPQGELLAALQIPTATLNRKAKTNAPLAPAETERLLGLARLLGQLQTIVEESGNPAGFNAPSWLSTWLTNPIPALAHACPLTLIGTMTGQSLLAQLLAQMQSAAYA